MYDTDGFLSDGSEFSIGTFTLTINSNDNNALITVGDEQYYTTQDHTIYWCNQWFIGDANTHNNLTIWTNYRTDIEIINVTDSNDNANYRYDYDIIYKNNFAWAWTSDGSLSDGYGAATLWVNDGCFIISFLDEPYVGTYYKIYINNKVAAYGGYYIDTNSHVVCTDEHHASYCVTPDYCSNLAAIETYWDYISYYTGIQSIFISNYENDIFWDGLSGIGITIVYGLVGLSYHSFNNVTYIPPGDTWYKDAAYAYGTLSDKGFINNLVSCHGGKSCSESGVFKTSLLAVWGALGFDNSTWIAMILEKVTGGQPEMTRSYGFCSGTWSCLNMKLTTNETNWFGVTPAVYLGLDGLQSVKHLEIDFTNNNNNYYPNWFQFVTQGTLTSTNSLVVFTSVD